MIAIILLFLLLQPAPNLTAQWDGPGRATVSWYQSSRGCLSVQHVTGERAFIGCYEKWPQTVVIELGHVGPLDGTVRPQAGDLYLLSTQGQTYTTLLHGRPVYLPAWRG